MYLSNLVNEASQFASSDFVSILFPPTNRPTLILEGFVLSALFVISTKFFLTFTLTYSFSTLSLVPGVIVSPSCAATKLSIVLIVLPFSSVTFFSPSLKTFILTVNVTVFASDCFTSTAIPFFNCVSSYFVVSPVTVTSPTNVVPSGILSDIVTVPVPFPLFVAVNLYVIVSNSCNRFSSVTGVPSACVPTLSFSVVMFATFVSGLSGISVSSIFATFFTVVVVLFSITTSSVNVAVPPFAFTSTSVHVIVFVALSYPVVFSFFILVPAGITSVTVTFPSAFPLFVNVIVYVSVSPTFAVVLSTLFVPVIFATVVSVGLVGLFPSTIAVFLTDVIVSLLIVTLNEISVGSSVVTTTSSHVIVPFAATPSPVIESATNVVPAGISSVTVTFPSAFPLFFNVIVYVSVSPTFAVVLSTLFVPVIFATFVSVSGVSVSPTIATFVTLVFVSWFTFTSKLTVISFPAGTVTFSHVIVPSSATTAPALADFFT